MHAFGLRDADPGWPNPDSTFQRTGFGSKPLKKLVSDPINQNKRIRIRPSRNMPLWTDKIKYIHILEIFRLYLNIGLRSSNACVQTRSAPSVNPVPDPPSQKNGSDRVAYLRGSLLTSPVFCSTPIIVHLLHGSSIYTNIHETALVKLATFNDWSSQC